MQHVGYFGRPGQGCQAEIDEQAKTCPAHDLEAPELVTRFEEQRPRQCGSLYGWHPSPCRRP